MGLYEGNYFINTPVIADSGFVGQLFSSDAANLAQCKTYLGRNCVANLLGSGTGAFSGWDDYGWFSNLSGQTIVAASAAGSVASGVINAAGNSL